MNEIALIGKKIGMTREFYKTGQLVPVTVLKMEKARVIQVIEENKRGYKAVQLGYGKIKNSKLKKAMKGYFAKKNTEAKKILKEFRVENTETFKTVSTYSHLPIGLIVSLIIFFELIIVIGGWKYKPNIALNKSISIDQNLTNTHSIGNVLYTEYIHLFQLSGMILLVAMVGAIVLTFKKRSGIKRQSYIEQISREKSSGVSLVDVESNKGVKIDD